MKLNLFLVLINCIVILYLVYYVQMNMFDLLLQMWDYCKDKKGEEE